MGIKFLRKSSVRIMMKITSVLVLAMLALGCTCSTMGLFITNKDIQLPKNTVKVEKLCNEILKDESMVTFAPMNVSEDQLIEYALENKKFVGRIEDELKSYKATQGSFNGDEKS